MPLRFCSDSRVKFTAPFVLLLAIGLSACETSVNRRSLYSPAKASGPYTQALKTGSWKRGEYPAPKTEKKQDQANPPGDLAEPPPAQ